MFKEIFGEAFPIIEKLAPTVATSFGSPLAGIATSAILRMLGEKFGIDVSNSPMTSLSDAILNDPDRDNKLVDVESIVSEVARQLHNFRWPNTVEVNLKMNWSELEARN